MKNRHEAAIRAWDKRGRKGAELLSKPQATLLRGDYAADRIPTPAIEAMVRQVVAAVRGQNVSDRGGKAFRIREAAEVGEYVLRDINNAGHDIEVKPVMTGDVAYVDGPARRLPDAEIKMLIEAKMGALPRAYETGVKSANSALERVRALGIDTKGISIEVGGAAIEDNAIANCDMDLRRIKVNVTAEPTDWDAQEVGRQHGLVVQVPDAGRLHWADVSYNQQKRFETTWSSSADPDHSMIHEVGHAIHARLIERQFRLPGGYPQHVKRMLKQEPPAEVSREVSRYGATENSEFVAEVFAGAVCGRKFSKKVWEHYTTVGGPHADILQNAAPSRPLWDNPKGARQKAGGGAVKMPTPAIVKLAQTPPKAPASAPAMANLAEKRRNAAKKAWATRLARGWQPKKRAGSIPRDPNDPDPIAAAYTRGN